MNKRSELEEKRYKCLVKLAAITGIISRYSSPEEVLEANHYAWEQIKSLNITADNFYVDVKNMEKILELL